MNFERDFDAFAATLDDLWSLKGQALSGGARMIFFRALEDYPLREVEAGIFAHSRDPKRGQFLPMPADVIAQIQGIVADDGRPGAEEAWAQAFRATDEAATVVWSSEMAEAFGIARPLALAGDEVAARMSFKEAYTRLVSQARERRVPVSWTATLGHDAAGRNAALLPHVQAGRLSADLLLDAPRGLDEVLALPAVEETQSNRDARAKARAVLLRMRAEAALRNGLPSAQQIDRERTAALKSAAAAKVSERLASEAP
jgi:hypothetical protein